MHVHPGNRHVADGGHQVLNQGDVFTPLGENRYVVGAERNNHCSWLHAVGDQLLECSIP